MLAHNRRRSRTLRVRRLVFVIETSAHLARFVRTGPARPAWEEQLIRKKIMREINDERLFESSLATLARGVNRELTRCPKCHQRLVDEGVAYSCRFGCGKMWYKLGASVAELSERERMAHRVYA